MSLDQIKGRANNPFETARLGIGQVDEDRDRLIKAVEAVEALAVDPEHYDSRGPSNGYVSVDNLRAAITAALSTT